MKKQWFCLVLLLMVGVVFGQNYVKHQVLKGETLVQIAQKYQVSGVFWNCNIGTKFF